MHQLGQTTRVAAQVEHLGQDRKTLLGHRGARGRLAQEGAYRLRQAVLGGPDVHPGLMGLEEIEVTLGEHAVLSHLDVVAPGGGVGRDPVVGPDIDHSLAHRDVAAGLQDSDCLGARDVPHVLLRLRVHVQSLKHLPHLCDRSAIVGPTDVEDVCGVP